MPAKAGQIVIDISAGTAKFIQDMDKAKAKVHEFGSAGVSEAKATRALFKGLEGDIANNSRAAEQFAEEILGIGKAAEAMFPVTAGLAFAGWIGDLTDKAKEFFSGLKEGPEKIESAFRGLNGPLRETNDELAVANDRLENDLAKLQGRPENNIKVALDETTASVDKMGDSIRKTLDDLNKLLKTEGISDWKALLGIAGTGDIKDEFEKFSSNINEIKEAGGAAVRAAAEAKNAKAQEAAQTKLNNDLLAAYANEIEHVNGLIDAAKGLQAKHDSEHVTGLNNAMNPGAAAGLAIGQPVSDQSGRLATLHRALETLNEQRDYINLSAANGSLTRQKYGLTDGLEARKQAEETMVRLARELADARAAQVDSFERINLEENNELQALDSASSSYKQQIELVREIYDTKRLTENNRLLDLYNAKVDELNRHFQSLAVTAHKSFDEMWGADIKAGISALDAGVKSAVKWAEQYNQITAAADTEAVRHRLAMAAATGSPNDPLGTLATQQAILRADIEERYEEKLKAAVTDLDRSIALREKELEIQKLQNQEEETTATLRHKGIDDFFRDMQGQAKTAGDILYDSLNSALDRTSDEIAKLATGQKTSFGKMLQSLGEEATKESVKSAMQKGLGAVGKKLGIHAPAGKPDGTPGNPLHVVIDGQKLDNPMAGIVPQLPPALGGGAAGFFGGLLKGAGGLFGKLFGGGAADVSSSVTYMAGGGDAEPGKIYKVAEAGEGEFITPHNASTVTPLSKLTRGAGGGDVHYYIDARGADLGAENRVTRAIEFAHNSAVQSAMHASAERARRTPRRR